MSAPEMDVPTPEMFTVRPSTYAEAHGIYRRAGWTGPLPLPSGAKWPPPDGFTGWHGAYPSGADSQAWIDDYDEYRDTPQLALRMADDIIGLDVDHYGDKRGGDTLAEAERRWGALPDAPRSSARSDPRSGIRFYRVEKGTTLRTKIGFPELDLGGIEIIQRHHRYAVVWPSLHPVGGMPYVWHNTAGPDVPPLAARLYELPAAWVEALKGADEPGEAAADPDTVAAFARQHDRGEQLGAIRGVLAVFERDARSGARHDAMVAAACMGAREAAAGRYPAAEVRSALRQAFTLALAEAKAGQRLAGPTESRREFESIWAWAVGQALAEPAGARTAHTSSVVAMPKLDRGPGTVTPLRATEPEQQVFDAEVVDEEPVSSWQPVDLGPYLRGEVDPVLPSVGLARSDGVRLLYPGKEHAVIGEMESGKSWFSLACVAVELLAGRRVLYVHFEEDDPTDTVTRLLLLGVPTDAIAAGLTFIPPTAAITYDILDRLTAMQPALVVLDGQNEAMSLHGQGIREEDGAAAYRRLLVKPFTAAGAAVLSCDHVTKDTEKSAKGYALGSVHKGNGLNGTLILLENEEAFGIGRRGATRVYVTKDRPGQVRRHGQPTTVPRKFFMGMLTVDATDEHADTVEMRFWPPREEVDGGTPFGEVERWFDVDSPSSIVPAELAAWRGKGADAARDMFRVLHYVNSGDGMTTAALRKAIAEGGRTYSDSVFFEGRSRLLRETICVELGSSRMNLEDKFRPTESPRE